MVRKLTCPLLAVLFVLSSAVAQEPKSQTLSIFGVQFTFSDSLAWKMTDLGNTGFMAPDKGKAMVLFLESKDKQCGNVITALGNPIPSPFAEGWFKIASNTVDKAIEACIESPQGTYLAKVMGIDAADPSFSNVTVALNALGKALVSVPAPPAAPTGPVMQTIEVLGVQFQVNDSIHWKFGNYGSQQYVMNDGGELAIVLSPSPIKSCGKLMDRLSAKGSNTFAEGWYKTTAERSDSVNLCIESRRDTYLATIPMGALSHPGFKNLANVMSALGKTLKK
jgi:hypothetical protein